jgi:hypothetical protein
MISKTAVSFFGMFVLIFYLDAHGQYTFHRDYAYTPSWGINLSEAPDQGYCVSYAYADSSILLFKTKNNGEVEWARKFYNDSLTYHIRSVISTPDSGILLCGWNLIMKTTKSGNLLWARRLTKDTISIDCMHAIVTPDSCIIVGSITSSGGAVFKLSNDGIVLWSTTIQSDSLNLWLESIVLDDNGQIICSGGISNFIDYYNYDLGIFAMKLTAEGDLIWNKAYLFDKPVYGTSIAALHEGYCIGANWSPDDQPSIDGAFLMKIDLDGNFLWGRLYYTSFIWYGLSGIIPSSDGNIIIEMYGDLGLMKVNDSGEVLWSHLYHGYTPAGYHSLFQCKDGGYISAGYLNGGPGEKLTLIKSNNDGSLPCNDSIVTVNTISQSCNSFEIGYSGTGIQMSTFTLGSYEVYLTDSLICLDSLGIPTEQISIPPPETYSMSIFPNPTSDRFIIKFKTQNHIDVIIKNNFGETVKNFELYPSQEEQVVETSDLPVGVYLLLLIEENEIETRKIIVQR